MKMNSTVAIVNNSSDLQLGKVIEVPGLIQLLNVYERNGNKAVSARELHQFLGSKRDFSNWIKDRIQKYQFVENQDFEVFNNFGENPNGGRPLKEYILSLDVAKELAMVENNDKGREARKYFIAVEKSGNSFDKPTTQIQMLLMMAQEMANLEQKQIEQDRILQSQQQVLTSIIETQEENRKYLEQLNLSEEVLPEEDERTSILRLVATYVSITGLRYDEVWKKIYSDVYYLYKTRLTSYKKLHKKESLLDVAERTGNLHKVYTVISDLVKNSKRC